jgi:hypothetical protein
MNKPILLWTERPVPLERELETHSWMEANRAEVERRFELVYDNAPGDWRHYSKVFRECWNRSAAERRDFFNLESDVVPSLAAWDAMLVCPELACCTPYIIYGYNTGKQIGWGAIIEQRCPGGWDSHFARGEEKRAVSADLGFVRFSSAVCRRVPTSAIPELQKDDGLLHEAVWETLKRYLGTLEPVHLHWPGLMQNHRYWDDGDFRHHPPGFQPVKGMLVPAKV